jgi:porphobilinogen deaminase
MGQGAYALLSSGAKLPKRVILRLHHAGTVEEVTMEREILKRLGNTAEAVVGVTCQSFGSGFNVNIQALTEDGRLERKLKSAVAGLRDVERLVGMFNEHRSALFTRRA